MSEEEIEDQNEEIVRKEDNQDQRGIDEKVMEITVSQNQTSIRLDAYVTSLLPEQSKSFLKKLIKKGNVTVDSKVCSKPSRKIRPGEVIRLELEDNEGGNIQKIVKSEAKENNSLITDKILPEDIKLDILHEDNDVIVLIKPKGMVVHPSPDSNSQYNGTLVNALIFKYGREGLAKGNDKLGIRPGIVHRLDKETSGVMVVAKNDQSYFHLSKQFKKHSNTRIYHAITHKTQKQDEGTIDTYLARHPQDGRKRIVVEDFKYVDREKKMVTKSTDKKIKNAVSHFKILKRYNQSDYENSVSLIEFKLDTGRTHQIRVHSKHFHMPLVNDEDYTNIKSFQKKKGKGPNFIKKMYNYIEEDKVKGQYLHAKLLGFEHPSTGKYVEFESPYPTYFQNLLNYLDKSQQNQPNNTSTNDQQITDEEFLMFN